MASSGTPISGSRLSEPYVPVRDVAERLGIPLTILLRRIEAGDVPAQRVAGPEGVEWRVRLSDLGIEAAAGDHGEPTAVHTADNGFPGADRPLARRDDPPKTEREQVSALHIDPRELVSGLLDRWERTLEQRIYAEQRQRFESELNARQNLVKQLQLELQTVRAEAAAVQADRDRHMAELQRRIEDMQRELDASNAAQSKRRSLFRRS